MENKIHRTIIEPFKIKMTEPLPLLTRSERHPILEQAGYNLFLVAAKHVTFDFLTDSGTSAMSSAQWQAMIGADESYAGSSSFERFKKVVQNLTQYPHILPTHQGRAAERLLFSALVRPQKMIPSNRHFDTTRANIEQLGGIAEDLVIAEGKDPTSTHPFKGNIDLSQLFKFCLTNKDKIPLGMLTLTDNTGGGQPVSLENIREAAKIYHQFNIPFILDICRFAENCYFIKEREAGQNNRAIREIAQEIFSYADGCMMSAKKDGLSNIGGFIALKESNWVEELRSSLILTEGFPTYGGLAARDLDAMAVGLEEVLDENYLAYRVATVRYMAQGLNKLDIPTLQPPGGHAVYIDAKAFLPHIPVSQFPGQALAVELYLSLGVRSCEIGTVMFKNSAMELVRLAFPRRVYTQAHFDYVLEGMEDIVRQKKSIRGLKIVWEPKYLRHFTARFQLI